MSGEILTRLPIHRAEINPKSNWYEIYAQKNENDPVAYLRFVMPLNDPVFKHPNDSRFITEGLDLQTEQPVAVKVIPKSSNIGRDLGLREARAMHQIKHHNAMPLVGLAYTNDAWLIIMPLFKNMSLDKKIQPSIGYGTDGQFDREKATQIINELAQFIDDLHAEKIHHGNLTIADIYETESGIIVGDFGSCSLVTGEFNPRTDIVSLEKIADSLTANNYSFKKVSNTYSTATEFAGAFEAAISPNGETF